MAEQFRVYYYNMSTGELLLVEVTAPTSQEATDLADKQVDESLYMWAHTESQREFEADISWDEEHIAF